jgi:hypothetical protein
MADTYDLVVEQTLWILTKEPIRVARIHRAGSLSDEKFYTVTWQPIQPGELAMIQPYLTDF